MPLKIELTIGDDTFKVEGDAMDPSIVDLAKAWVGALPPANPDDDQHQDEVDGVTDELAGNSSSLAEVVNRRGSRDQPPAAD